MGKGDLGAFGKIVGKVVALEFKEEATQNLRELLGASCLLRFSILTLSLLTLRLRLYTTRISHINS